jgi:ABC-type lipoprotein release transport system permease subunit
MWPVLLGAVSGVGVAALVVSSARSLLFGIEAVSIGPFVTGGVIVLAVTTVACLAPAWRAARTDVVGILRAD